MHACRLSICIESTFGDHGGKHGQESEESKEEDSQEEKEIIVGRKPHKIRIAPEVRCALRSTDRSIVRRQNIRATNSQAGPLCRWLLHNGPVFRLGLDQPVDTELLTEVQRLSSLNSTGAFAFATPGLCAQHRESSQPRYSSACIVALPSR
jgi:hypothetical protein